jgi:hypothetical protein
MKYYHSDLSSNTNITNMVPSGYYEKIIDDCPQPLFGDIGVGYRTSDVLEISFSKSISGSILGGLTTKCKNNEICVFDIYSTQEDPDVDISMCMNGDFSITEEVRYRRKIPVQKEFTIQIPQSIIENVNEAYGKTDPHYGLGYVDYEILEKAKLNINKLFQHL